MTDHIQRWTAGSATITSVVEDQTDGIPPEFFFPKATAENIQRHTWLQDHYTPGDGTIGLRVQATVLQLEGQLIVVDPCVGNGKRRHEPYWDRQTWPFMERFEAAGFDPARVDLVVHTHLHVDHVGWDTRLDGHRWVPTFPNAHYLYVDSELDWLRTFPGQNDEQLYRDSVEPIIDTGQADLVAADADLGHGLNLSPTPGHTPGHASLWLSSGDARVLITGDTIHHPFQFAEPDIAFVSDQDPSLARKTRRELIEQVANENCHLFGTHFPTLPYGRVLPDGQVWHFAPIHPPTA